MSSTIPEGHIRVEWNGMVLIGTPDQIKALGVPIGPMYNSSTSGLVPISTMNTVHIVNAMGKLYKAWVDELFVLGRDVSKKNEFLTKLKRGPDSDEFKNLLSEFIMR